MRRSDSERLAGLRAEWFAQLAQRIEDAQRLAWQIGNHQDTSSEARELYSRLEVARLELDCLRNACPEPQRNVDPEWLRALGWSSSLGDSKG